MVIKGNGIPYYMQISRILRGEIIGGKYHSNEKLPDEQTIAARFKVSKDVIRVSLRQLAEDGLVKRIRSKGTFVCENPTGGNRKHVLLMVCQNTLGCELLRRGVQQGIGDLGYDTIVKYILHNNLAEEEDYLSSLDWNSFAAMVITGSIDLENRDNSELFKRIIKQGIPLVMVDHEFSNLNADAIFFDDYNSTLKMAQDSFEQYPCKKIAIFHERKKHRITVGRNRAMNEFATGLPPSVEVLSIEIPHPSDQASITELANQLKQQQYQPELILGTNSYNTWNVFSQIRELGLARNLQKIFSVSDSIHGDAEYNSLHQGYYRLYDEFIPTLAEILQLRLNSKNYSSLQMIKKIQYTPMSHTEAMKYFSRSLYNSNISNKTLSFAFAATST